MKKKNMKVNELRMQFSRMKNKYVPQWSQDLELFLHNMRK